MGRDGGCAYLENVPGLGLFSLSSFREERAHDRTQDMGVSLQQFSVAPIIKDPEAEVGAQPQN